MAISLKKFAKSEPAKAKKETTPTLELNVCDENINALKTIIEQKKAEKAAETLRKKAETVIRPKADTLREAHCQKTGVFASSIHLKCGDVGPVSYVNQQRYSAITTDTEEELKKIFGEENYSKCFRVHTEVALTEKGLKEAEVEGDNGLLARLVAACGGEEKFGELFEITQTIKPTEFLHEQKILDTKLSEMAKKAADAGILKQASSSFSV